MDVPYSTVRGESLTEADLGKYVSFELYIGDDYPIRKEGILASVSTMVEEGLTYNYISVIESIDECKSYGGYNVAYRSVNVAHKIPSRYRVVARQFSDRLANGNAEGIRQ